MGLFIISGKIHLNNYLLIKFSYIKMILHSFLGDESTNLTHKIY